MHDNSIQIEEKVILKTAHEDGSELSVCFLPTRGMNFTSYKKGELEVIDPSTQPLFEERWAGLGAMIGPHFHHRNPDTIPPIKDESLFPHIAKVRAGGSNDPFSHGIGRYAPWTVESISSTHLKSVLKGEDVWRGVPLKDLEGQNFQMEYGASLTSQGLAIQLSVRGETETVVGLHTYYALSGGGRVISKVGDHYNDQGISKPIPSTWNFTSKDHTLTYELDQATDFGFQSFPDPFHSSILMQTKTHSIQVRYWSDNEENSWQLWHPQEASFVCIEPLSAKDPRKPRLTVNNLKILISIL